MGDPFEISTLRREVSDAFPRTDFSNPNTLLEVFLHVVMIVGAFFFIYPAILGW